MQISSPEVLAFDFDGVVCDGLVEYFQTAWKAYCQLYQPKSTDLPEALAEPFYRLRPVVETGWEMPILLRALIQEISEAEIIAQWPRLAKPCLEEARLTSEQAAAAVDGVRDRWIQSDLPDWLSQHRFYPGMLDLLNRAIDSHITTYIISTKEGRFIQQLLQQNGVLLEPEFLLGKEAKRPKYETLQQLYQKHSEPTIWFIEDRLPPLSAVKRYPELDQVGLFLADWGYNLERDRTAARQDRRIRLLSLDQVVQEFPAWLT
ncbi:HAD family hydrolase [Romeria aff. gracilis LEGE 07310]|uniref:HAD family hydrolase n=1 Tax=Vasconcelosia minhoensis LEGE 07310 TaxID=915328 RepID=A0A8J7AL81_9CYAN|nr:HAD family hydrolase [Romeria gracilis]MBE9079843.1 HAD family hydrolase [Romeria aff. gracilis LEGE 07310]